MEQRGFQGVFLVLRGLPSQTAEADCRGFPRPEFLPHLGASLCVQDLELLPSSRQLLSHYIIIIKI